MSAVGQLVCLLLLCGCALSQSSGGAPSSPCPNVFQYVYDREGDLLGRITIVPPLSFSKVKVQLQMTTTYFPLVAGVGKITIRGGDREIQEITNKAQRKVQQTIQFLVIFPPGQPVPRVSQVVINGRDFCPNNIKYPDTRGEINLNYEIKNDLPLAEVGGDQFYAPGTQPVYVAAARPEVRPVQHERPAQRPGQKPYEPQPIPTQFPSVDYHTSPTQFPYFEPEPSTTQRPYVPPRTTQRPYVPPRTTQPPYVPPRTTQPPYVPPRTTQPPYVPPFRPPYESQTTRPKTPPKRPANNGQSGEPCGRRVAEQSANQLIIDGDVAEKEHWPWHAAVYSHGAGGQTFLCGGVLVSKQHVLTAAHCVTDKKTKRVTRNKKYAVSLGRFNLQSIREKGTQLLEVGRIAVHPQYSAEYLDHDIAMLTMDEPAEVTRTVSPVCIWDLPDERYPIVGKRGEVVGWGRDRSGELSPLLRRVSMPVVSHRKCKEGNDDFFIQYVTDANYCAGDRNGSTVCNGDSGGGMYFLENKKWYVRGIVNLSKNNQDIQNTCSDDDYVIFADLAKLHSWIVDNVQPVRAPAAPGDDCGTSIFPLPLIIGGSATKRGQWPWHVAVNHVDDNHLSEKYICGGTVLGPRLVITVAHCVTQEKEMQVVAGRYDLSVSVEDGEQKRAVSTRMVHPDYDQGTLWNDVALLKLDEPLTYSDFVRPACLWDSSQIHVNNVIGKEGTVVGWGFDETYQTSDLLLSTAMPVVSRNDCVQSNREHFSKFTSNTTYCAGYKNGTGACNGDSGGGMYFRSSGGQWFLRGLISTSVAKIQLVGGVEQNVCDVDNYNLFTDVAKYLNWIEQYLD